MLVGSPFWMYHIRQFESWTIMAAPGSPHLLMVIDDIMDGIRQKTGEYGVPVSGLTLEMTGDVIDFTGPRRLTRGVLKSLELVRNETIDMASISNLLEPVLVEDVLSVHGNYPVEFLRNFCLVYYHSTDKI